MISLRWFSLRLRSSKVCAPLLLLSCAGSVADVIHVAAASNFSKPLRQLATDFEAKYPHKVRLSFASSGKLFAKISHGAPFHLFLSADQDKVTQLIESGGALSSSRFTYAIGRLAFWAPGHNQPDFSLLISDNYRKLALANPRLAPYGLAAQQTLTHLDAVKNSKSRWVLGENIAQTYQFVASGNAELGLVALSQLIANSHVTEGAYRLIPNDYHQPIRQDLVITGHGESSEAAKSFWLFMKSQEASETIQQHGYWRSDE